MTRSIIPRPLVVAMTIATAILAALAIARVTLWTYGADAGTFAQIVLDAFGGMHNGVEHGTHFRFHWSPSLAVLWPLMAATHSVLTLQVVQVLATVAAAPLLYALIVPYVGTALATRIGVLALLYPPLIGVAFSEFHEVGLFAPLALGMMLAADRRAWWWFAGCALLVAGLREDLCIELVVFGCAIAAFGTPAGKTRATTIAGTGAAFVGAAALAIYYLLIVPRLGDWKPAHFYVYGSPDGHAIVDGLRGRFTYLVEVFAPLAFLPFRSRWSLLAIPGLAIVLLANEGLVWRMGTHYPAIWIPWLLIGAAFGVQQIAERAGERIARRWIDAAMAVCAIVLVAFNPLHPLHYLQPNYHDLASARKALACVPLGTTVATHDEWYTAIAAQRPEATVQAASGVDALVYADDFSNGLFQSRLRPEIESGVRSVRYAVVCRFGAVATYRRKALGGAQQQRR